MAELKEKLFTEFASITTEEWMAKITTDLKGAPFEKKLVWKTSEGFNVNPFYRAEDIEGLKTVSSLPGEYPFVRGTKIDNNWYVRQNIKVVDFAAANAKAKEILMKGITSLGFQLPKAELNAENIAILLDGICPGAVELNFRTCMRSTAKMATLLVEYFTAKGLDLDKCYGSVCHDSFKKPLTKGVEQAEWLAKTIEVLNAIKPLKNYRALSVNALNFCNAGSTITQELGYALSWGNELMAKLTEAGFSADEVADRIKFNFGISSNFFMEIAKLRSARMLWAQIVKEYAPASEDACKMHIHSATSTWNKTVYDAHVNLLRTQTESMSASIGGADSITVNPFDVVYQDSDDFSERIARNQQLLLKEECHFDKVVDPAAGSYYVEVLTKSIADVAWGLFLDVEKNGGFEVNVYNGSIQTAVNASNEKRRKAVATRREILLGTNQFPNFSEMAASKIANESSCGCSGSSCATPSITKLDFARGASDFETLRLATEAAAKRPKAFMLTIGNLAMRLARSQFSCNFFACAGYETVDNLGFDTVEAGVEAAMAANADIVVICSSDDEYTELAPAAFKALDGRAEFVVAGMPACMDDLKAQGITQFVNVRSNVLETLQAFNEKLSI